jgi:hypothetical protein
MLVQTLYCEGTSLLVAQGVYFIRKVRLGLAGAAVSRSLALLYHRSVACSHLLVVSVVLLIRTHLGPWRGHSVIPMTLPWSFYHRVGRVRIGLLALFDLLHDYWAVLVNRHRLSACLVLARPIRLGHILSWLRSLPFTGWPYVNISNAISSLWDGRYLRWLRILPIVDTSPLPGYVPM